MTRDDATIDTADVIRTAETMINSDARYTDTRWRLMVLDLLAALRAPAVSEEAAREIEAYRAGTLAGEPFYAPPAAGAPRDFKDETLAAMLLTHLWRYIDAGGLSMGRSFYAQMLEPARTLLDKYRPHADIADWPSVDDTRRVAERRAAELVREEANRERERLGIPAYWEPPAAGAPPACPQCHATDRVYPLGDGRHRCGACDILWGERNAGAPPALVAKLQALVVEWRSTARPLATIKCADELERVIGSPAPAPVAEPRPIATYRSGLKRQCAKPDDGFMCPCDYTEMRTCKHAVDVAPPAVAGGDAPAYDQTFGDDRECACGHTYERHFDTYDDMKPVGCKYCDCPAWRRQEGQ